MYVCYCASVNDRAVEAAIDAGAHSIADLKQMCGAGTGCKGCLPALAELLAAHDQHLVSAS
jgi:bacterioferritin-associated ferredoxin